MTKEETDARKALHCLYIAVDQSIARDVALKVESWVRAAERAATERAVRDQSRHEDQRSVDPHPPR